MTSNVEVRALNRTGAGGCCAYSALMNVNHTMADVTVAGLRQLKQVR